MDFDRDSQIAWAAGLFEGEGSFGAYKVREKYWNVTAQIAMADVDALERFAGIVGIGTVGPDHKVRPAHHRPTYRWRVNGKRDVCHVINLLLPWLCERRRQKALEVRAIAVTLLDGTPTKTHCKRGHALEGSNVAYENGPGDTVRRRCRTCRQAMQRAAYARRKASC